MDPVTGSDYYQNFYPDYEKQNPKAKLDFYMSVVRQYVPSGSKLFELGVGKGLFLEKARLSYECWGSDINEYGVAEAARRAPGARLFIGSSEVIPADVEFDGVVAWDVLEHLPDLAEGLGVIHGRLKPGGHLIAVVPVYDGPLGPLVHWLDKDPTHVTKKSRYFWLRQMKASGFKVVAWRGIIRKLLGERYIHWTAPQFVLKPVGSALLFVARKNS